MRWLVLLALLVACLVPSVAYADDGSGMALPHGGIATYEDAVIDDGPPKGVVGADGMSCTGRAAQDGHTLKTTTYTGVDGDEWANHNDSQRTWREDNCKWQLEQNMSGWFLHRHNVILDVSRIKITYKEL